MNSIICYIKEFEGIIGAILGSVATLIVTDILKRKGKLKIYLINSNGDYHYYENVLRGSTTKKTKNSVIDYFKYDFTIDIYNSSELPKIMREIKVNVYKNKELLKEIEVKDESTRRLTSARCVTVDNLNLYNISAKESVSFDLSVDLPSDIAEKLKDGLILKMCYKDEKNKSKYFELFNGVIKEPEIQE